ncbi:hypothetical protein CBM2634_A180038 [Cupriavidus taiwanensis]|uniref:Uncharacterized protein n=1 Tax=Cupriavidus taiwanensis TaxID=164546 RepID=A0A375IXF4_9BURK|nr:hypothetical protein CBM2634_A180038 [Cupriavidus taiwanensis]
MFAEFSGETETTIVSVFSCSRILMHSLPRKGSPRRPSPVAIPGKHPCGNAQSDQYGPELKG